MSKSVGRVFGLLCACAFLLLHFVHASGASLENAPDVSWAAPSSAALNNLGPVAAGEDERGYACTNLTYRLIDDLSKTMQQGCFVRAAFGMLDPNQAVAIFNGTDEAESIRLGGSPASISIIPGSVSVAQFGGFPVEGTYMYLYNYLPNHLANGRDLHLQRYKELTGAPDTIVRDSSGQALVVNPQAFAYSGRGQWFVTESPSHALVRVNLATFSVLPFDKSYDVAGKPYASHVASMAITGDGRYAAAVSNEFSSFSVYDLAHCVATDSPDVLAPQACQSHNYWSYIQRQVTGELRSISQVSFVGDNLIRFHAVTSAGTETYLLSPQGPITSLIPYLGLGDSFASGQGAFNYQPGTDTELNRCHLSVHSYPLLLSNDVFGGQGQSVACSGAVIHDITDVSDGYTGQAGDQKTAHEREADGSDTAIIHSYEPGYLAQERFATTYQPGVLTVEVGGNDVGFKDMILRCISPVTPPKTLNDNDCYSSYEDRLEMEKTIDRWYPKWRQLYKDLQQTTPLSRIYAIGYPQIVSGSGRCGLNMPVTSGDISLARDATTYLNSVIRKAALASGVTYVEVGDALAGHELCDNSPKPAVNGLTAGTDIYGVLGQESFHPTTYGQELLEQAILAATKQFASPANPVAGSPDDSIPEPDNGDALLQAPASGRPLHITSYDSTLAPPAAAAGQAIAINHGSSDADIQASSGFTITLNGSQIGAGQTDGQGGVATTVVLPPGSPGGTQPISISGQNTNGDPITITTTIYVYVSSDDYDGDGVANGQDSCPLVRNSGIDSDHDGTDDVCDQYIGSVGSTTPPDAGSGQAPTLSSQTAQPLTLQGDFTGVIQASNNTSVAGKSRPGVVTMSVMQRALQVRNVRKSVLVQPATAKRILSKTALRRVPWWLWLTTCLGLVATYYTCRVVLRRGRDYGFAAASLVRFS